MNALKIVVTLLACSLLLWWMSTGVRSGLVYDSVHAVGYRAGAVLPQGFDTGSELSRDQAVRIESVSQRAKSGSSQAAATEGASRVEIAREQNRASAAARAPLRIGKRMERIFPPDLPGRRFSRPV